MINNWVVWMDKWIDPMIYIAKRSFDHQLDKQLAKYWA